ncbi:MAG: exodeoxyribonuclease VII large subunit, partial [Clostridia bacterium]
MHGILVSGEVTNFKIAGAHAYFNLKDDEAQISCTFFNITKSSTMPVKNGDKVIVRGSPDFYVKGGTLTLKVNKMTPQGLGELYIKFLELKERLAKEGLFDESHKIAIPVNPKRIGVVTSRTGAVIQDIINVTSRRNPYTDIVLFPVKVQGENAEIEIARGVTKLDEAQIVDVIIVGRGGGSMEDLQAFNTEIVARAVYNCQTPIISAVGHETDFSLCDFASDLRAPTPSAAAEQSTIDLVSELRNFVFKANEMSRKATSKISEKQIAFFHNAEKLKLIGENKVARGRELVISNANEILNRLRQIYKDKWNDLQLKKQALDGLNPLKMLDKGFAKVLIDSKV